MGSLPAAISLQKAVALAYQPIQQESRRSGQVQRPGGPGKTKLAASRGGDEGRADKEANGPEAPAGSPGQASFFLLPSRFSAEKNYLCSSNFN